MNAVLKPQEKRELLIGCGNNRRKLVHFDEIGEAFQNLTTLDIDPGCEPDVVHDLNITPYPFESDAFDEIHAYECLEHVGHQGDWRFFFRQWQEFYRILKPGGYFVGSCPMWDSPWAWSDPGHTRVITKHSLVFLRQAEYENQVGRTHMTDYRSVYSGDFETVAVQETEHSWGFVLRKL